MTVNAAFELCRWGIRVNCIIPGAVESPFWNEVFPPDMPQAERDKFMHDLADQEVPMGRIGKPDDIAGVALFFASDLSKFVTGLRMYVAAAAVTSTAPRPRLARTPGQAEIPPLGVSAGGMNRRQSACRCKARRV